MNAVGIDVSKGKSMVAIMRPYNQYSRTILIIIYTILLKIRFE